MYVVAGDFHIWKNSKYFLKKFHNFESLNKFAKNSAAPFSNF
jgi:hypothetical protein